MKLRDMPGAYLLIDRFADQATVAKAELDPLLDLPCVEQDVRANHLMSLPPDRTALICNGCLGEQRIDQLGNRQFTGLYGTGELVSGQISGINDNRAELFAIQNTHAATFSSEGLRGLVGSNVYIALALWTDAHVLAERLRHWLHMTGANSANTRVARYLIHVADRFGVSGDPPRMTLPTSQEQMGDSLNLTPVHVNRVLRRMEDAALIERTGRCVTVPDWDALQREAR